VKSLIEIAGAKPNAVSYASAGSGGINHFGGALFSRMTGTQLVHVPYKGGAPAMTDVAGGNVDLALADLTLAQPFLQGGKVRPLAIASAQRSPLLPDVPTTAEVGLKGVRMDTWYGLFAPAGVPAPVLDRLRASLERGLTGVEVSWLLEDNDLVIRSVKIFGGRLYKTYRMYDRAI